MYLFFREYSCLSWQKENVKSEGAARSGQKEYAHFISIARGSLAELNTQIQIAKMLGYYTESEEINKNLNRLGRLLTGLYKKWNKS
ncbi:four helix bundle protein [Thiohalophilus sp.]|uniref:four helix bundle protein n=1 Tax=Thiohalophilus sp. TaxID=3028392 RepID=UPI002ACE426F|nr:four helix bundle protein [Thiohalophilus sp.]MDZ7662796.1 four helix bundle protein [Thiohalophilus sp.]